MEQSMSTPQLRPVERRVTSRVIAVGLGFGLALVAVSAWWMRTQLTGIPAAIAAAEFQACQAHLRNLYVVLSDAKMATNSELEGDELFCALLEHNTRAAARDLSCPSGGGTSQHTHNDAEGACRRSGYALADRAARQKALTDGGVALAACSTPGWAPHDDKTNLLLADGSIIVLSLSALKDELAVPATDEFLLVGPDSRIELLKALRTD